MDYRSEEVAVAPVMWGAVCTRAHACLLLSVAFILRVLEGSSPFAL